MIDKVKTILAANSTVNNAATGGIWADEAPQGKSLPYIILSLVDGEVHETKNTASQLDVMILQVTTYAKVQYTTSGTIGAYSLMESVRSALDFYDSTVDGTQLFIKALDTPKTLNLSIPNNKLMGCDMEFEVYVTRDPSSVTPTAISAFSYSNNGQSVESSDFVTMVPSTTPSTGTFNYYLDANDTLPTGLSLDEDSGYITRSGSIPNGDYSFDIIVVGSGLASGVASVRVTLTVASVGPSLSNPVDAADGETASTASVDTDTAEGLLYWVQSENNTEPTGPQIKAGQDGTGSAGAASGSQAVNSTGTQNISSSGLSPSTTYYTFFYQEDDDEDGSNVSSADGFTTTSGYTYLLDSYGSAVVAYAMTKLRNAYSGNAIRVRRSSDNAEQDIGFSGNDLDESALTTFVGAGDGFITTFYDQSGNGDDLVQTTASLQPRIVNNGTIDVDSEGNPYIVIDNDDFFTVTLPSDKSQPNTYFLIGQLVDDEVSVLLDGIVSGKRNVIFNGTASDLWRINAGSSINGTADNGNRNLFTGLFSGASSLLRVNGSQEVSGNAGTEGVSGLQVGKFVGGGLGVPGLKFQALVMYNSDQTSNFSAIETILNDVYTIY